VFSRRNSLLLLLLLLPEIEAHFLNRPARSQQRYPD
jgi:hypothetical protein